MASLAEIVVEGRPLGVYCPVTGIPVITEEAGFDSNAEHSPYVRFVIDWIGGICVADPNSLGSEGGQLQRELMLLLKNEEFENQNRLVEACCKLLPQSSVVMEFLDPPWGSFGGEICYVCFDFSRDLMGVEEGEVPRRRLVSF